MFKGSHETANKTAIDESKMFILRRRFFSWLFCVFDLAVLSQLLFAEFNSCTAMSFFKLVELTLMFGGFK
jgi:hypothetical protein